MSRAPPPSSAPCRPKAGTTLKADQSPVTLADDASEAEILQGLARLLPGVPVVSEEMSGRQAPPKLDGSFILVDPLDGTREFIAGRDEYTVNVAIISGGKPIAGIVSAPKRTRSGAALSGAAPSGCACWPTAPISRRRSARGAGPRRTRSQW